MDAKYAVSTEMFWILIDNFTAALSKLDLHDNVLITFIGDDNFFISMKTLELYVQERFYCDETPDTEVCSL